MWKKVQVSGRSRVEEKEAERRAETREMEEKKEQGTRRRVKQSGFMRCCLIIGETERLGKQVGGGDGGNERGEGIGWGLVNQEQTKSYPKGVNNFP